MFQAFQDILKHKTQVANWTKSARIGLVLSSFDKEIAKIFSTDANNKIKAMHISDGRLVVACLDVELLDVLKAKESEIIATLNNRVADSNFIKQLYFLE